MDGCCRRIRVVLPLERRLGKEEHSRLILDHSMVFQPDTSHLNRNVIEAVKINTDLMTQSVEAGEVLKRACL